jgi:hypothetical protein
MQRDLNHGVVYLNSQQSTINFLGATKVSVKDHVWKKDEKKIEKKIAKRNHEISAMVRRTYEFLPDNVDIEKRRTLGRVLCRESNALGYLEQHDYKGAIGILTSQASDSSEYKISLERAVSILKECFAQNQLVLG